MKKIALIFLASFLVTSIHATKLKNGVIVEQQRIDQVWKAIKKTDFWLLLKVAVEFKNGKTIEQGIKERLGAFQDEEKVITVIAEWTKLKILKNGILDKETQEIIIASYFGDREPVLRGGKFERITPSYPVKSWISKALDFVLFKAVKKNKNSSK